MNELASERIDAMLRVFKMKYLIPKNGLMFIMVLLLQGQDQLSNNGTPTARTMLAILAAQGRGRLALERAEEMVNHAEESREQRGVRTALPSSGSGSSRPTPTHAANDEQFQRFVKGHSNMCGPCIPDAHGTTSTSSTWTFDDVPIR